MWRCEYRFYVRRNIDACLNLCPSLIGDWVNMTHQVLSRFSLISPCPKICAHIFITRGQKQEDLWWSQTSLFSQSATNEFIERPVSKGEAEENRGTLTPGLQTGSMQARIHTFSTDTHTHTKNTITKRSQCSQWVYSFVLGHTDRYSELCIASLVESWTSMALNMPVVFECIYMKRF